MRKLSKEPSEDLLSDPYPGRHFLISLSFWGESISVEELEKIVGIKSEKKSLKKIAPKSGSKGNTSWHSILFKSNQKNGVSKILQSISKKLSKNRDALKSFIEKENLRGKISISMGLKPTHGFEEIPTNLMKFFSELNISFRFGVLE